MRNETNNNNNNQFQQQQIPDRKEREREREIQREKMGERGLREVKTEGAKKFKRERD